MKSLIRYVPGNVLIDLAAPLGPDARAIIERHYRDGSTPKSPYNRDNPAFICVLHEGGTSPGLFIKKIGGQWWAVHYESATGCRIRIPAPMSDEHKRQAEYWARAAEDAGYRAELECSLDTGTRTDVLIYGSVKTGIEVQCSPITARERSQPDPKSRSSVSHGRMVQRCRRCHASTPVGLASPDCPEQGTRDTRRRPVLGHHTTAKVSQRSRTTHNQGGEVQIRGIRQVPGRTSPLREVPSAP